MAADLPDGDALEAGRLQLLGRLLPAALHELSNPLLALGGTLELLAGEAPAEPRSPERLELVRRTADEITEIVRALQRLARERLEPEQAIDLAAFVRETASLAVRFSDVKGVEARVTVGRQQEVRAAPGVLRQALLALLLDALQASPRAERVELRVDSRSVEVAAGAGGGFPAETAVAALGGRLELLPAGGARIELTA